MKIIITTVSKKFLPVLETLFVVGLDGKVIGEITLLSFEEVIEVKTSVIGVLEDGPKKAPFTNNKPPAAPKATPPAQTWVERVEASRK